MVDFARWEHDLLTAQFELTHTKSRKRKHDLRKYIGRLYKQRAECALHLRGDYGKRKELAEG